MARGLGTGLLHGAVIGGAALVALSLWAPLDGPGQGADPLSVDLPVGSEFGRGDDRTPDRPATDAATPRAAADPVAVPAPAPETAPVTTTTDTARPEAQVGDAPALPSPVDAAPRPTLPARVPVTVMPEPAAAPDPGAGQDAPPRIAPEASAEAEPAVSVPALPSPGLDLSLPPDLTDLRAMERN